MRLYPRPWRMHFQQSFSTFAVFIILFAWHPILFAETLPTPSLKTSADMYEWNLWDFIGFCSIFGIIILLILAFAKKHDEIDL